MAQRGDGGGIALNTRVKWLCAIYEDMTGTAPPESFWNTPTGKGVAENNPAYLYDQPTCNLDEIIRDLPEKDRKEVLRLVRVHNKDTISELKPFLHYENGESEEETLFYAVLVRSSLRVPTPGRLREIRHRRTPEREREDLYRTNTQTVIQHTKGTHPFTQP